MSELEYLEVFKISSKAKNIFMKVAIIEDEKSLSGVLKEKLENEGYKVSVVYDGEDAMPLVKKTKPDAILLDIILPGKDGFKILEELREDDYLSEIPVIVLSNLDQDDDIKKAMSLGASDYYVKTQHPLKEIVDKIEKVILKKGEIISKKRRQMYKKEK